MPDNLEWLSGLESGLKGADGIGYGLARYCAVYHGQDLVNVSSFESSSPGTGIMLTGRNILLEFVEVFPLVGHEIPPECGDLERVFSEALRLGATPLKYPREKYPHLPSPIR